VGTLGLALTLSGCASDAPPVGSTAMHLDDRFDRHRLVDNAEFTDADALDAEAIQGLLAETPWGFRSFLADKRVGDEGVLLSEAVARLSRDHALHPMVLLATLQKESSLVAKREPPNRFRVDYALGCGCPDNAPCLDQFRGLGRQLDCAADVLQEAYEAALDGEPTRSGRRVGEGFRTLDGRHVVPENAATVSLYTYTPWVLEDRGGNWLFWRVWRRLEEGVDADDAESREAEPSFNDGFIGGLCSSAEQCMFERGQCSSAGSSPRVCTRGCTRFCPDARGATTTFCITRGGEGQCVAGCDGSLPGGCPDGFVCERRSRHNQPTVRRAVCVPEAS
jgi:hypothetical protein